MNRNWEISRRAVLKGIGTAVALPALEVMAPSLARVARAAEGAGKPALNRMVFVFVPNGKVMEDWTPKADGAEFELPYLLEPLSGARGELCVLTGLGHRNGLALGDGPGDHARSAASYLTGAHPFKTGGKDIRAGVSVDQYAAAELGGVTRLASLELGCDKARNAGICDSGYSCAYSHNISWRTEHMPMAKETDPKLVFERLFSDGSSADEEVVRRSRYRKSLLDVVSEDANRLRGRLGAADKRKLDEYFASVRELEQRVERVAYVREEGAEAPLPATPRPTGVPREYQEHVRLMYDLLALALQADVTRIATFMLGSESSNRPYRFLGVPDGHHTLSHHGGERDKIEALRKINHFHVSEFARFIEKLKAAREGEGSVLDHAMVAYGSGLADGNRHDHLNLPVLLVGRGGGTIRPGRHIRYAGHTPMSNLFLSLLDRMGVKAERFGDSTGRLPKLEA